MKLSPFLVSTTTPILHNVAKGKFPLFLQLAFTLTILGGCNLHFTNEDDEAATTINEFYTKYMTTCAKWSTSQKKLEALKLKYLTPKLLKKLSDEELDYDPILNAQDCDFDWLRDLSVTKDSDMANVYIVSYSPGSEYENVEIRLVVVKDEKDYKIDSIL